MPKGQTKRCPECGKPVSHAHKDGCSRPKNKKKGQK